jgi:hexokinase
VEAGLQNALENLAGQLSFPAPLMRAMIAAFHEDMERGLRGEPSSLKMLPTFTDNPSGREKGDVLALDLGGTNVRVLWARLTGDGRGPEVVSGKFKLEPEHISTTGEALFGAIARFIRSFLDSLGLAGFYPLGFTFSFPIRQHSIRRGELILWTKGWTASGVEGRDVAALMDRALKDQGVGGVRVVSLNNDTTGTQIERAYFDPACDAGCILGTGTNICYREQASRIRGPLADYGREHMIVNMESGNFNRGLPRCRYDAALDARSENAGAQWEEKMVSGKYLGELVRLAAVDWAGRGLLFGGRASGPFAWRDLWSSEAVSALLAAPPAEAPALLAGFGADKTSPDDAAAVREIGRLFVRRAARIAAAALAAAVTRIDPGLEKTHTAAVDGSLFEKMPGFRTSMGEALAELYGDRADRIAPALTHDGSGLGAAIIAAAASAVPPGRERGRGA